MSKAVLMSIKPQYCEMIFRGEKDIEIRKRAPKLKPPFKVYVYCTLDPKYNLYIRTNKGDLTINGFVIGEFVCDRIIVDKTLGHDELFNAAACLTPAEAAAYCTTPEIYGLHISRPRFYLKPKELSRFIRPCPNDLICEECESYFEIEGRCCAAALQIIRPPQSWMYVEEWDFNE